MKRFLWPFVTLLAACAAPPPSQPLPVRFEPDPPPPAQIVVEEAPTPPQPATGWHRAGESRVRPLTGGSAWLHEFSAAHDSGARADLQVVIFDIGQNRVRVVDQPDSWAGGGSIDDTLRAAGAVAGVNGGFFSPDFAPLGLMIAQGRRTGVWQSNKLLTGALVVANGTPRLVWNAEGRRDASSSDFLQAGPRLVDAGRPMASLDRVKNAARTFIAASSGHLWAIGVVKNASLFDLGSLLAAPELIPGFRVQRALNLDGGRSSAIYARLGDGTEISDPGWSTVRNYIGIVPVR
ncbi:MAG: phosphodiester glycosidase family protein [Verrucomicrobiaceae bacterium]|nr:phosphodiester glycosidase family protein [Verrucomicrobiaceae bacterium]